MEMVAIVLGCVALVFACVIVVMVVVMSKDRNNLVEQLNKSFDRIMAGTWEDMAIDRHKRNEMRLRMYYDKEAHLDDR
jgi:predicted small secreted protein